MKTFIIIIIVAYLLICAIFFIFQRSFLYFPQPASYVNEITTHFDNNGQSLSGWVINVGQDNMLLYYGGNASAIESNINMLKEIAPQHTIYLIPYRGYGNNKGKPTEEGLYSDALHIYDVLKEGYKNVALIGSSLGSGVATFVAANRQVEKLVLVTPYDSISNVGQAHYPFLPVKWLAKDQFQSVLLAPKIEAKTLILIAENDKIILRERSEALANQFKPSLLTKVIVAGAEHNNISATAEYTQTIHNFLNE